ncbi:MAG: rRNA maturation RNase YbeY [Armatimonadota bacterium]|nr:rRNA maturation RNase YbeY [Armatimonadota bacterium]MDR7420842.1 rRNA maturation RNase YbeY [Armatimonadota bacterium]MDR7457819.1 rRNA maturation RNase YbeY [Armatimonadota bacterium]MDR7495592.1 rRNA maturation RNase YbeY [Armatimonadota bacterium]MDR7512732.1 rRNA maturation RNase YbeY [Armatimonadota bacterium]
MRVHVVTRRARHGLPHRWVARVARVALRAAGFGRAAELEVALVDDVTIATANRRFLGHRGPTDVLTFPAGGARAGGLLGEVVVSVDRARAQAREAGWRLRDEVALLVVHGVLHLAGYDDRTRAGARRMRVAQARILEHLRRGAET